MGAMLSGDAGAIEGLREALAAAGFDDDALRAALGGDGALRPDDMPVLRRRVADAGPLGTIAALFVLGVPVAESELAALGFPAVGLAALGLVEVDAGSVRPLVRITPWAGLLIVSDPTGDDQRADHVAGVHSPSVTLANLTVRRNVDAAADIGTGCGVQAILAARHAGRVVATDVSERALEFARFNALLNGAANVDLRRGSFFDPLDGERFGLAVCNPPYVISPETSYLFRDSGLEGDTVSREVVRGVPAVLEEDAFASMLVSWAHAPGEEWSAPLRDWVAGSGCDALLVHYGTQDPLTHASNWARTQPGDTAAYDATIDRWLDYLERLGIEAIGYGAIVLRRRSGENWVRAYELPTAGRRPAGEQIERLFDAVDWLAGNPELAQERFSLSPTAGVAQTVELRDGAWTVEKIEMRLEDGLDFSASIDPMTAHLVAGLDGRTLGEIAASLAEREGADPTAFAAHAEQAARGMFELGFLARACGRASPARASCRSR
jgi:methylase of polypeptide subunit release factors